MLAIVMRSSAYCVYFNATPLIRDASQKRVKVKSSHLTDGRHQVALENSAVEPMQDGRLSNSTLAKQRDFELPDDFERRDRPASASLRWHNSSLHEVHDKNTTKMVSFLQLEISLPPNEFARHVHAGVREGGLNKGLEPFMRACLPSSSYEYHLTVRQVLVSHAVTRPNTHFNFLECLSPTGGMLK